MKLYVNICFHYVEERLKYLDEVIASIQEIPTEETVIIVNSNQIFECEAIVNVAHGLRHPYHLTWEHKKYLQEFLNSGYDTYVYLEDDMKLSKQNINYWKKTKELFKKYNLNFIPALHRVEYQNGKALSLDATRKPGICNGIILENQKFIFLPEPYQGLFIMDRDEVIEHMNSQYYIIGEYNNYGIRESANLGNLYVNVPQGYGHRAVVPVENFEQCWIHHLSNNYSKDNGSPHAKILTTELLDGN